MQYQWKLARHLTLYEKYFKLDEYSLSHELFAGGFSPEFTREVFDRGAVVVVLPYDPQRRKVVLIEQFRIGAIDDPAGPWLIETVAGVIGPGESTQQVAMRESVEEAGCQLQRLQPIAEFYVSPGASNEHCSLFCGVVDSDGVAGIHGLADENEDIRVTVVDATEAFTMVREGKIRSAPTIVALQWLELNQAHFD
jgi:ADP-ribose pyrophosphatase